MNNFFIFLQCNAHMYTRTHAHKQNTFQMRIFGHDRPKSIQNIKYIR